MHVILKSVWLSSLMASNRSCELRAIDFSGHTNIGQDQIHVGFRFENTDSFVAAIGLDHIKARAAKLMSQVEPQEHLVLNHENGVVRVFWLDF